MFDVCSTALEALETPADPTSNPSTAAVFYCLIDITDVSIDHFH